MRKLAWIAVAVVAAAGCGSSSSSSTAVSGTFGGTAFTPAEVNAVNAPPTLCTFPGLQLQAAAVAIGFTSYSGFCSDITNAQCAGHKDARAVTVFVANVLLPGATGAPSAPPAITAGTYTVTDAAFGTVGAGLTKLAFADVLQSDASCASTPTAATGSIRIDQVGGTQVTGYVDLTWANGGKLQGNFTANVCSGVDVCTAVAVRTNCPTMPVGACQ